MRTVGPAQSARMRAALVPHRTTTPDPIKSSDLHRMTFTSLHASRWRLLWTMHYSGNSASLHLACDAPRREVWLAFVGTSLVATKKPAVIEVCHASDSSGIDIYAVPYRCALKPPPSHQIHEECQLMQRHVTAHDVSYHTWSVLFRGSS